MTVGYLRERARMAQGRRFITACVTARTHIRNARRAWRRLSKTARQKERRALMRRCPFLHWEGR